jgi:hypothetical protein
MGRDGVADLRCWGGNVLIRKSWLVDLSKWIKRNTVSTVTTTCQ